MSTIQVKDGTTIYYKDWGTGRPMVFSHGWPLNADAWDPQMLFFGQRGFRVIAHDRRGHGRSGQSDAANGMDTYADDLAVLFETLDLKNAVLVGHSAGGGEVLRYLGLHGTKRVSQAVLVAAVAPLMLKTGANPEGQPRSVFDQIRADLASDRSQFLKDFSLPFYGYNRPNVRVSEGVRDNFRLQGLQGSIQGQYDCIETFSETDFTADLKRIDIPTLLLHGNDDQIVPLVASALSAVKLLRKCTLKIYPGSSHGVCTTEAGRVNSDILAFVGTSKTMGSTIGWKNIDILTSRARSIMMSM